MFFCNLLKENCQQFCVGCPSLWLAISAHSRHQSGVLPTAHRRRVGDSWPRPPIFGLSWAFGTSRSISRTRRLVATCAPASLHTLAAALSEENPLLPKPLPPHFLSTPLRNAPQKPLLTYCCIFSQSSNVETFLSIVEVKHMGTSTRYCISGRLCPAKPNIKPHNRTPEPRTRNPRL